MFPPGVGDKRRSGSRFASVLDAPCAGASAPTPTGRPHRCTACSRVESGL